MARLTPHDIFDQGLALKEKGAGLFSIRDQLCRLAADNDHSFQDVGLTDGFALVFPNGEMVRFRSNAQEAQHR